MLRSTVFSLGSDCVRKSRIGYGPINDPRLHPLQQYIARSFLSREV